MSLSFVPVLAFGVSVVAQAQTPLRPVTLQPPAGGGNPIVINAAGVEQDPAPIAARWNADDQCLGDIACFVASWIEANTAGDLEHLTILRAPEERAELERRFKDPVLMSRNASRFKQIRSWSLAGWIDYGTFRFVMLTKDDPLPSTSPIYTLPLKKTGARWGQTDALATDTGLYQIIDRVAKEVADRHRKK